MLDSNLKAQLKGYLGRISGPVEITASVDDSDKSREMLELLSDIESASKLITIEVRRAGALGGDALGGDAPSNLAGFPSGDRKEAAREMFD